LSPEYKLHSIIVTITIFTMYRILTSDIIQFKDLSFIIGGLITFITSAGFYRLLFVILSWILGRSILFKKLILGSTYMEGTWVGFYRGRSGKYYFLIETYEQTLTSLNIRGSSYAEDGSVHASWNSVALNIDPKAGRIVYIYEGRTGDEKGISTEGICSLVFERRSWTESPHKLSGLFSEMSDGIRIEINEKKVSSVFIGNEEALKKAKELYKEYFMENKREVTLLDQDFSKN
jgi:hypothetical protein